MLVRRISQVFLLQWEMVLPNFALVLMKKSENFRDTGEERGEVDYSS